MQPFQHAIKRLIDILLSALILALLFPLMLYIAVVIRWNMGLPILFRQQRSGKGGKPFVFYKFRTMNEARTAHGTLCHDVERLTPLGKFLRRWSLDELPQLWNVLRGDMSLVGPRPLLMEYLQRYSPEQARRHEVKPGITGWAQVNGRNAINWEDKFNLDVWYVDHWNVWLDLRILTLTTLNVLKSKGISAEGHCTMPEFFGSENTKRDAA
jgi:sugar transferase EpsL